MVIIELRGHVYVDAFHIFICCVHIFLLLLLFTALFTILVRFHRHKPKRNRISQKRRRRFALPTHSIASVYIHNCSTKLACTHAPFSFVAASAKSVIIVDHRSFPRVATTLSWAERHAGSILARSLRPFSVISSST